MKIGQNSIWTLNDIKNYTINDVKGTSSSTASYVFSKISGLQGYCSPLTPVIIQSPIDAFKGPSNVCIINSISVW